MSESEARLLLALGNDTANQIWEHKKLPGVNKPDDSVDRDKREEWIKYKYLARKFLVDCENTGNDDKINIDLYEAAKSANLMMVATALAHGADVDWKNADDGGKSPLHACAIAPRNGNSEWLGLECAELILQNGANMKLLDSSDHNVLDCAVIGNAEREMVEYLSRKFE